MKVAIHLSKVPTRDVMRNISSFLLHDPFGTPSLIGMEYRMPEGTAWTIAASEEPDFYRILATSGILHTEIPGSQAGTFNLLCTPALCRGMPRWFLDVESFSISTETDIPFFLAFRATSDRFERILHSDPDFRDRWRHNL